jgi:hypothetical protein
MLVSQLLFPNMIVSGLSAFISELISPRGLEQANELKLILKDNVDNVLHTEGYYSDS